MQSIIVWWPTLVLSFRIWSVFLVIHRCDSDILYLTLNFFFCNYNLMQDGDDVLGSCTMWEHLDGVWLSQRSGWWYSRCCKGKCRIVGSCFSCIISSVHVYSWSYLCTFDLFCSMFDFKRLLLASVLRELVKYKCISRSLEEYKARLLVLNTDFSITCSTKLFYNLTVCHFVHCCLVYIVP